MKCKLLTKICGKSESSLSFNHENPVTDKANQRPVKAVHRDERCLSLAQIGELYQEITVSEFCMHIVLSTGRNTHA